MIKIAIVTTGHPPFDDRIYWKFAKSLSTQYDVSIICSTQAVDTTSSNIKIKGFNSNLMANRQKFEKLYEIINTFSPDIIICSEIAAVIPSKKYKQRKNNNCKIVADITEWYPENIASKLNGLYKIFIYLKLFLANIYLCNLCDKLIIGEPLKKRRYDFIAPLKGKKIIGYYPVVKYFKNYSPKKKNNEFVLGYAGVINFNRGILPLLKAYKIIKDKNTNKKIKLIISGRFDNTKEEKIFKEKIKSEKIEDIEIYDWTDYDKINKNISKMDICFDLRKRNFIYNYSLPIKIFEYLASGKPVIYSDIKSLHNLDIEKFGSLVDPENINVIVEKIEKYLEDDNLYTEHSKNAREYIESGNTWEIESEKLLNFIQTII